METGMDPIKVGVVGYGYWGPNLARNLFQSPRFDLVRLADMNPNRLTAAQAALPGVQVTSSASDVLAAPDIEAVVVATPISTHFELGMEALRNGKHLLIEKPMTDSVATSEQLMAEAEKQGVLLMVDHTFVYTEVVEKMREFVVSGALGDLYYIDSIRANLGLFQRDSSVLWDLAPHDLSVLQALLEPKILAVSATGACHAGSRVPNIAYVSLDLEGAGIAHFHVSWLSPVKVRRIMVAGSKRMLIFDDNETSEKLKMYDSGVRIEHSDEAGQHRMQVEYRVGDMVSPALPTKEALKTEMEHFADCIQGKARCRTGGDAGLAVVRVLEAAQQSMERGGERVRL
jgi:predicted dehydrogenase